MYVKSHDKFKAQDRKNNIKFVVIININLNSAKDVIKPIGRFENHPRVNSLNVM